ncbi:hypothetical protein [Xenorhabdus szentirmaii]|uniref:Regulator n=1 Tax=Xenorhabdus szentirmaii DSM 16338 TaxID=1427518 RepID=W1ITW8_9GAMM|nr:hypothetical protein [Xenorhabdus szentirmaii]PHM30587.1 hypothetical protein Xsze_04178 [Xenorhabdus szentirmaii DSM 16338]CDL81061.1 putative regulator [Xenorhabdus szentirmaii DSM 16338]
MSTSLLELIRGKRKEIATKNAGRGIDTVKLQNGVSYLRVFPNMTDPNGVFYHAFGMHFVKTNEGGKAKTVASICKSASYGEPCELCEALMEAKAIHKGNEKMEELITDIRSSQRFLVNGVVTTSPELDSAEKAQLVELPQTVFDDVLKGIEEHLSDEIGNPLSATAGYAFKIERTGAGRDTKYSVSPNRKSKCEIPAKLTSSVISLENFVASQGDVNKIAIAGKAIGALTGVAVSVSSTMALPATGTTGAALPGFSAPASDDIPFSSSTNVAKEAAAAASEAEFTGVDSAKASAAVSEAPIAEPIGDSLDANELEKMMKELEGI